MVYKQQSLARAGLCCFTIDLPTYSFLVFSFPEKYPKVVKKFLESI